MTPDLTNPKLKVTDVCAFFGTWNVNGINPPKSLDLWLGAGFKDSDLGYPDIYCVGFQELDMSANALLLGNEAKVRPWENAVYRTLSTYDNYEKVSNGKVITSDIIVLFCVCFMCVGCVCFYYRYTQDNLSGSSSVSLSRPASMG